MLKWFGKSRRASADHRQHLAATLFKDMLESLWEGTATKSERK